MFTGIIEQIGVVTAIAFSKAGVRLHIDLGALAAGLADGESVAVDGVCLTTAQRLGDKAAFDVVPETLSRTTLGKRTAGTRVNLERSLRMGERLGGHIVQGHVDATGHVVRFERRGEAVELEVAVPPGFSEHLLEKGSIAVDGVSLTLAGVREDRFVVALVPYTLEHTTLGERGPGEEVNLEGDVIGKWVRKLVSGEARAGGLTLDALREHGFAP